MLPLLFMLFITAIGIFISISISPEVTWFDFYKGGIAGLFLSSIILYYINKRRRKKELEKEKK